MTAASDRAEPQPAAATRARCKGKVKARSAPLLSCSAVPSDGLPPLNPTLLLLNHTLPRTWDECTAKNRSRVPVCSPARLPAVRFTCLVSSRQPALPCHYCCHHHRVPYVLCCLCARDSETSTSLSSYPASLPSCLPACHLTLACLLLRGDTGRHQHSRL